MLRRFPFGDGGKSRAANRDFVPPTKTYLEPNAAAARLLGL
jgi:hypothetical protein